MALREYLLNWLQDNPTEFAIEALLGFLERSHKTDPILPLVASCH